MTVSEALARADALYPNQRSITEKLAWLSSLDGQVLAFLRGYEDTENTLAVKAGALPYAEGDMGVELLVPFPYDELYVYYLYAQVCFVMGEVTRYENALLHYNALMQQYRVEYARTHMPIQVRKRVL